eukprot:TRINITY_DN204_c0_g1_i1.p1 TRINITY_DN204_c0_g1~~TRINITY_DN204_c0_g1_i1.p1  ORF type:complete len:188 (+),score=10.08 TRINITY_DN204_c0_g1_i1:411-974(+)
MGSPATKTDMLNTLDLAFLRGQITQYWDRVLAPPADCSACQLEVTNLTAKLDDCKKELADCDRRYRLMVIEYEARPPRIEYVTVTKEVPKIEWRTKIKEVVKWRTEYVTEVVTKWRTKIQEVIKWRTEYVTKWRTEYVTQWRTEIRWQTLWQTQWRTEYIRVPVVQYVAQPCYTAYNNCRNYCRRWW